jgi:hypothetical protein
MPHQAPKFAASGAARIIVLKVFWAPELAANRPCVKGLCEKEQKNTLARTLEKDTQK